jgi:hypothetical protein
MDDAILALRFPRLDRYGVHTPPHPSLLPPGHGKGPRDPIGGFIPLADFIKRIPYAKI